MADFLSDLADYLDDQGVGNSSGASVNIFAGNYPDDPANCVALLGLLGGQLPNENIQEFEYPRFQVIVRNTDYETGGTKLRAVRDALHVLIDQNTTNFKILRCHSQQDGGPIGRDKLGRYEFTVNFYGQVRELEESEKA